MIDILPPYPPAVECVSPSSSAVADVTGFLTLSGDPAQVGAVLEEVRKDPTSWRLDADAETNGIRFVRLSVSGDVPYRVVGGLIFQAQRRRLAISFVTDPPICRPEVD